MTSAVSSLEVGGSVGRYRLERLLGRGETGSVYLADAGERPVTLKIVAPELARSAQFRERFLGDCELLIGLEHPNLLPVYDAGEADGALFVAMRFVEGADLGTILESGPLPAEQAVSIVGQAAGALHTAHCSGLVHRGLEPSSILVEASTHRVFVGDFGLVGRSTDFAAPERIEGRRLDGRADVYSLGAVLAACLRGELWPELERVVAKARAKDPAERYTTAPELAHAARQALLSMPAPARPPVVENEPPPESPPSKRRRNVIAACAALVVVAGAAAGLVASLGGGTTAASSPPFAPRFAETVAGTLGAVGRTLGAVPVQVPPQPVYDTVANTGGVGVRYRSSPALWCGGRPQTDPCWRTVIPGAGAAEGQQLRVYCYATGASVHGDTWWARVSVAPAEYVPTAFLRSAAGYSSIAPPTSLRC